MPTQYAMTAIYNGSTRIYWVVTGAPDNTGSQSGYPTNLLTSIAIDYTTNVSSTSTGGQTLNNGGWTTALDLDLTSLSSQLFSSDGNYTVNGYTWNKTNTAQEISYTITGATNANPIQITTSATNALLTGHQVVISGVGGNTAANGTWTVTVVTGTTFTLNGSVGNGSYTSGGSVLAPAQIINGIGLVFIPNTGDYYNGRTCPALWSALSSYIPNFDMSTPIRIWFYNSRNNAAANYDNAVMAIDTNSSAFGYVNKRGMGGTGLGNQSFFCVGGAGQAFVSNNYSPINNTSNNVCVIELSKVNARAFTTYRGTYSSSWPTNSSLTPEQEWTAGTGAFNQSTATSSNMGFMMGAHRVSSTTVYLAAFARIKIEYISITPQTLGTICTSDGYANIPTPGISGRLFLPNDVTKPIIYRDNGSSWAPFASGMIIDTFANRPAIGANGQVFIPSDGGNQQVWDGTKWRPILGSVLGIEPPPVATLSTQVNYSTSTLTKSNGILIFEAVSAGDLNFRGAFTSISTPSSCQVQGSTTLANNISSSTTSYPAASIAMRESSTGKMGVMYFFIGTGSATFRNGIGISSWTSATNRTSFTDYYQYSNFNPCFMRIIISSGTLYYEISNNLINWKTLSSQSITSIFTTAPDQYGIGVSFFGTISSTQTAYFNHLLLG